MTLLKQNKEVDGRQVPRKREFRSQWLPQATTKNVPQLCLHEMTIILVSTSLTRMEVVKLSTLDCELTQPRRPIDDTNILIERTFNSLRSTGSCRRRLLSRMRGRSTDKGSGHSAALEPLNDFTLHDSQSGSLFHDLHLHQLLVVLVSGCIDSTR